MRYMVIVYPGGKGAKDYEAGKMPDSELLQKMGKFNEELVDAGIMLSGDGLHPSAKGTRINFSNGGKQSIAEGPFTDSHLIGGFWIWQVKSKEEALAWAKKAPMEDGDTLELRQVQEAEDFGPEIAKQERELIKRIASQQQG